MGEQPYPQSSSHYRNICKEEQIHSLLPASPMHAAVCEKRLAMPSPPRTRPVANPAVREQVEKAWKVPAGK